MRTQHSKLKTQLFSCGIFGHCTQTVLSPTTTHPPSLSDTPADTQPPPPPPLPPPKHPPECESYSSSSSAASQSFTQWKFPLPTSPVLSRPPPVASDPPPKTSIPVESPPPVAVANLEELFHSAELNLTTGSDSDRLAALHLLDRSLVPNPPADPVCPPQLMRALTANLKEKVGSKPATKILLAFCLAEGNRRVAVETGAVAAVVESVTEMEASAAERALAALELMCTVPEGAAEIRAHALAVPVLVTMMGTTAARGKEYAISVMGVIYGGWSAGEAATEVTAPPEEVARAVALALQGDSSARGRRKGAQLLKVLQGGL